MGFWHQSDPDRMSFNFVQMNESNFRVLTSTEVLLLIRQIWWKVKVRWWMLVNKERVRQRTKKLTAFNWTLFETFMCAGRYLSTGLSPLSPLLSPVIATVKIEERVVELRQVANRSALKGGQLSVAMPYPTSECLLVVGGPWGTWASIDDCYQDNNSPSSL